MMHEVEEYCWQSGIEGSIYTKGGGVRDTWGGGSEGGEISWATPSRESAKGVHLTQNFPWVSG